jgi:tRNA threonylcarbamoyladenosine biosynthesis protein TsaB
VKILAVNTATKSCSVGIVDKNFLLVELILSTGQTHSKHLTEMIDRAIQLSGLTLSGLDGFAVTMGPGSFTGLRIGVSTVKGLVMGTGKPLVGVSTLDALAMQAAFSPYLVCSLLDARKGEVYFSRYRFVDGTLKKEGIEGVFAPPQIVDGIKEPCLFIGDGALLYQNEIICRLGQLAHFVPPGQNAIRASTVAYLAMDRFVKQETDDVIHFVPHYIRKSDAELKIGKSNSGN